MKRLNVTAQIERLTNVTNSDGSPIMRNSRIITHRLILSKSASFEQAIEVAAKITRTDNKIASFCLKRDDGRYAIDLSIQQVTLLTGGRMSIPQFQFVCKGATFNGTVEFRNIGDEVNVRNSDSFVTIEEGHAAFVDLSSSLSPAVEGAIVNAMFATHVPYATAIPSTVINTPTTEDVKREAEIEDEPVIGLQKPRAPIGRTTQAIKEGTEMPKVGAKGKVTHQGQPTGDAQGSEGQADNVTEE